MPEELATTLRRFQNRDFPDVPRVPDFFSFSFLRKHACIPLLEPGGQATIVMADPTDISLAVELERLMRDWVVKFAEGDTEAIAMSLDRAEQHAKEEPSEQDLDDVSTLKGIASEAPVIRQVDYLVNRALDMRASDLHFESGEGKMIVRCRVDGILHELEALSNDMRPAVISRIKLMANLDIAERRLPQDGGIKWRFGERQVDIRVATTPSLHGEDLVLRLLTEESGALGMDEIGLGGQPLVELRELMAYPNGMILVTGPTGSGKTTTLYSMLQELVDENRKLITVEDPVERKLDGVSQIQVKPSIGLSFAKVLRSIVRHDPDVVLVGEIRDEETARIAIESALTGHLVLSTLHTRDAAGAITRLRDLGIEEFLIADSLLAVVAQRLVRQLCPHCSVTRPSTSAERALLEGYQSGITPERLAGPGPGCDRCGNTGYLGRQGIFEVLRVDDAVRGAIVKGCDAKGVAAASSSYRPLVGQGIERVLSGATSLSETLRVIRLD